MSVEQVTAVLSGKRMFAPPKDIAEVQNAYEIYDNLDKLDPYSVEDLLKAHGIMVKGLRDDAGEFRNKPVGVVDSNGNVIHFGTLRSMYCNLSVNCLIGLKTKKLIF